MMPGCFLPLGGTDGMTRASFCPSETSVCHILATRCVQRRQGCSYNFRHLSRFTSHTGPKLGKAKYKPINRCCWKDIHDLDGIHGYWRNAATVTLIVHNNHEQVAAGNLLYDKRSAAPTMTTIKTSESERQAELLRFQKRGFCLSPAVPDAALTVDVSCCFLDGAFRDKGWILCIAGYHQGLTASSLS